MTTHSGRYDPQRNHHHCGHPCRYAKSSQMSLQTARAEWANLCIRTIWQAYQVVYVTNAECGISACHKASNTSVVSEALQPSSQQARSRLVTAHPAQSVTGERQSAYNHVMYCLLIEWPGCRMCVIFCIQGVNANISDSMSTALWYLSNTCFKFYLCSLYIHIYYIFYLSEHTTAKIA